MKDTKNRCWWAPANDPEYIKYHDEEWGVPTHNDRDLFEMLVLEGAQAGLSWSTILHKRGNYRKAFDNFEVTKVANYDESKIEALLQNKGIVRNQLKIRSAIKNARVFITIQEEFGSFNYYIWSFVSHKPIVNHWNKPEDVPAITALSKTISKDLKKRGMSFVGPTIIYAYMQSIGMVNDHLTSCFIHPE
ncbi:DNA-3-methyladenine glycosylase 1 [Salinivirga cyanobacteriivorans]|uniref:DNA-3-methyladenine glycosylase I n=1 Tax=Salinivirga cyanobacteriivorans TaxID=1307839 RepID=A0A0S2HUK4_9BACT|nr:DNA-3-methyladenine glycosylase I [Salinivirga cyanobacteriivorans]ALO13751.1 DNA-3-methyladenine glycosylase 1 [Salinivirga cyanobacteriivorans]